MNIVLSTSVIQRGQTGIAQYTLALVRALLPHAATHRFHLLVLRDDLPRFDFARDHMSLVPVDERWRPPLLDILWHQTFLPRLARSRGWDLLHVPSYRRLVGRRTCTLAATVHDLAPFRLPGKYDPARMLYGRLVARSLARRQHALIAVSRTTAHDIERFFGVTAPTLHVVTNGLDHTRFHPGNRPAAQHSARTRHHLDRPFLLYLSRLEHPAKNHVRLIHAFERFKHATASPWLLALAGPDWLRADTIHHAAANSNVSADIRFLGFVPDADLPDLYRAAEISVFPSLHEGFGFPPLEAMACACPVISSDRGALGETLQGAAEIIDPDSVDSIANALQRLAQDEGLRRQRLSAGLENARRFDWDRCARETLAVWEQAHRQR